MTIVNLKNAAMWSKITLALIIIFTLVSCETTDFTPYTYSYESTIYSESNLIALKELIVILKPYLMVDNQKKYLVSDSITNVVININGVEWGKFTSLDIDTSLYNKEYVSDFVVTKDIVKYPVIAHYEPHEDTFTTAGEYSVLLNNRFTLEPGIYVCEIKSFEIKLASGDQQIIKTPIVEVIEIEENSRSTFVGEFDIQVNT